jgi:hypothetical protein
MTQQEGQPKEIKIQASNDELKGAYSNVMQISHNREEFLLDFFNVHPSGQNGILVSRIYTSPGHFKRMVLAMQENVKRHEENYGEIKSEKGPEQNLGFKAQ